MITKAIESAVWLNLVAIGVKVAGGLLSFGATVVVWVDGEGLLPITTVCLM
jgi:hypothetical protein